ncbi:hypothetical protein TNIN_481891 [Trichonephila inaurata madagascariensis]|uniref:Uncharacterized protein n=1 Tax=Trichonephila inaurata madagascariensis TaxID=2747483 RepID=A0A8X6WXW3_9ARAC|nr:hypothetical protein TNIN_481891 [Trichonephila inaurata madagascariensis]
MVHTYPRRLCALLRIPAEFTNRCKNCYCQATQQHNEHPTDVVHSKSVRLAVFVLIVSGASDARALPPLIIEHLDDPFLLQIENSQGDLITPWRP